MMKKHWSNKPLPSGMYPRRECVECHRMFNLFDEVDKQDWHYGHDCETEQIANLLKPLPLTRWFA